MSFIGHIASAVETLKSYLKAIDVVVEIRDARLPLSTAHPQLPGWCHGK